MHLRPGWLAVLALLDDDDGDSETGDDHAQQIGPEREYLLPGSHADSHHLPSGDVHLANLQLRIQHDKIRSLPTRDAAALPVTAGDPGRSQAGHTNGLVQRRLCRGMERPHRVIQTRDTARQGGSIRHDTNAIAADDRLTAIEGTEDVLA